MSSSSSSLVGSVRSNVNSRFAGKDAFDVFTQTLLFAGAVYGTARFALLAQKHGLKKLVFGSLVALAKQVPGAAGAIEAEKEKTLEKLEQMVIGKEAAKEQRVLALPAEGRSADEILSTMSRWNQVERSKWIDGRISGGIYHGGDELLDLCTKAYSMFALANPLHPEVFPFVRKMEAEVVSICLNLFHAKTDPSLKDLQAGGAMTSGGTESILMAIKTYRDRAYDRGITEPEMIIPATAHAAFDKAAHYFKIKLHKVPVNQTTFRADVNAMAKLINKNTCVIVGSAPCFPQGVIDPIEDLGKLAVKHDIGLHVDCCLGSFLVCYLERLGYNPPLFDFRVPGVSSISCDTHKYGFAPKGSSVVMYNTKKLRKYMYFVCADWTGGIYASPSMPGSRPGGLIAATWAALIHLGDKGYLEVNRQIMIAAKKIEAGINKIDGLMVCGKPDMSVIAFQLNPESKLAAQLNIFKVGEAMSKKHWNLNTLQRPGSLHICVTYMHVKHVETFLNDLQFAVTDVITNPDNYKSGSAAIYGMAESLPDVSLIDDIAKGFIDCLFQA